MDSESESEYATDYTTVYPNHNRSTQSSVPSLRVGYTIIVVSVLFFLLGSYATIFSAINVNSEYTLLDLIARDTHYKYFFVLLIPTTSYFVIANWVGWQYYRNS